MASADQLKALLKSHIEGDQGRFFSVAMQVAAHEASQGHGAVAHDIRQIVEKSRKQKRSRVLQFKGDLSYLVLSEDPQVPIASLVLPVELKQRIERVLHEYKQQHKLKAHGLSHRRKILMAGPPGTGKTMSAKVLAHELQLPLHTIQIDKLVTKFMGETTAKLRQIFDLIQQEGGVYLFDEFDAIGGERSMDNDVGEMRRDLNAFLQFIEQDKSDSLIVAATNSPRLLDRALYRRFDDVLYFTDPEPEFRKALIQNILASFLPKRINWETVVEKSEGLSHAEIDYACRDAIKQSILADKQCVNEALLNNMLEERSNALQAKMVH